MNCGIVTVYNSENCGSFLQAFALSKAIESMGHNAVFVRQAFSDHSASKRNYFKLIVKTALRGNIAAISRLKLRRAAFKKAVGKLKVVNNSAGLDYCILGSDVIWDLTVPFFRNHHSFFWGTQFENAKIVSYAASLGFAREDELAANSFVEDALCGMQSISVRDTKTKQLLENYADKPISLVCDPTYLIERRDYETIASDFEMTKFVFLYCYGNLDASHCEAIKRFAKAKGLKTVTYGNFNSWCDVSLPYDPLQFLAIYDKADYIITNTFHGTVFSTIYEKRFAVIKNEKNKIIDVLAKCGLSDKMTQEADDVSNIMNSEYNYEKVRENIKEYKERSLQYLKDALSGGVVSE